MSRPARRQMLDLLVEADRSAIARFRAARSSAGLDRALRAVSLG